MSGHHRRRCRPAIRVGALLALPLLAPTPSAEAAPSARLWPRWTAHAPGATRTIDHSRWTAFLAKYVRRGPDRVARLPYGRIAAADRRALDSYIARLSRVRISAYARPQQFAFWINLYNALTVQVVLRHWPVRSIRRINISPGLFARGPWGRKLVRVEGVPLSLDDIEHRILRPIWRDPRIHYAVNCASLGCPDLAMRAYTGAAIQAQLDFAARRFVNHPRAVWVDRGRLRVSSIYFWYKADFGGTDRSVIAHLRRYASPALRARLAGRRRIDGHGYAWEINALP